VRYIPGTFDVLTKWRLGGPLSDRQDCTIAYFVLVSTFVEWTDIFGE